jgi:hypothetical protein
MYLGSTLLPNDASLISTANPTKTTSNDTLQGDIRAVEDGGVGSGGRREWRRKVAAPLSGRKPQAQVGEQTPPDPAARSTDSSKIPDPPADTQSNPSMEGTNGEEAGQSADPKTIDVTIPEDLWASLRAQCDSTASVTLLGRIQGKHPGLKALTAWAKETLHSSLSLLSLQANNVFEVTFEQPEGRTHALNQADLKCESAAIFFSSWQPHFDATQPHETRLDHPVWMQVVNLCQILRNEEFLHAIGEQIGQVISIDSSEAYRAKLFGPRIRLLVQDLDSLPQTVRLPRLDGKG